jgi:hypothetical protein
VGFDGRIPALVKILRHLNFYEMVPLMPDNPLYTACVCIEGELAVSIKVLAKANKPE